MVKGNPKTSASSGTRKKHLKKHAPAEEPSVKEKRPKGKGKRNEPKVKMYIPPVKPAPVQPDPLETTGLAHTLPADLLVVLRNISKKAQVTKTRALEELQLAWVNQCLKEGRESLITYTLVDMLPVWLHHVSALFVNPSRRVRFLTASLHAALLQIPPVRDQVLHLLRETLSDSQLESILGTWFLATYDIDRQVAAAATKTWKEVISNEESPTTLFLSDNIQLLLHSFIQRVALDPNGVYAYLNPLPPPPPPPPHVPPTKRGPHKPSGGKGSAAPLPRKDDGDTTPRSKSDEQEESESDRTARMRIGALGAARWIAESTPTLTKDLQSFYSNPALWTVLQSTETCTWVEVESFGYGQPNVRKAGWNLVQGLLNKNQLDSAVPVLGTAILRSAWIELDSQVQGAMWQPLLVFLKRFPQCWTLDATNQGQEHDGSGSDTDSDDDEHPPKPSTSLPSKGASKAYEEFLGFLQLGCSGSPVQGYPAVVIIVSTIPSSILASPTSDGSSPLSQFFESFWAALDGRALSSLHRVVALSAFLSSLLECAVFLIKRMCNDGTRRSEDNSPSLEGTSTSIETASEALIQSQFSRVWAELATGKLKIEERAAARLLARTLEALHAVDQTLFQIAWDVLAGALKNSVKKQVDAQLVSAVLKVFYDKFRKDDNALKIHAETLTDNVLQQAYQQCAVSLGEQGEADKGAADKHDGFALVISILDRFRDGLFAYKAFSDRLDELFAHQAYQLLSLSPSLLLSYFMNRKNEPKELSVWHALLSSIASNAGSNNLPDQKSTGKLLDAAEKGQLPKYLRPPVGELDRLVGALLEKALAEPANSQELVLVKQLMKSAGYFISAPALDTFLQIIIVTFTSNVQDILLLEEVNIAAVDACIDLIQTASVRCFSDTKLSQAFLPDIFLYSYLVPLSTASNGEEVDLTPSQATGKDLWEEWIKTASNDIKANVMDVVQDRLKGYLENPIVQAIPEDILHLVLQNPPGITSDTLWNILPSPAYLNQALGTLSSDAIDPSIAIIDPLIPLTSASSEQSSKSTDRRGFSIYARAVNILLQALVEDRQAAKGHIWALRHFYVLSIYAQDLLNVPSATSRSPAFDNKVTPAALLDIIARTRQISVYLLNSSAVKDDDSWRRLVLDRLVNDSARKIPTEGFSKIQVFLFDVVNQARAGDGVRDSRVLKMVLEPLFQDGINTEEADLWVQYARKIEKTVPQTAMTIIFCVTHSGSEPPKLDRYRNEMAASIPGIKAYKANTDGLLSLRKLSASAPDADSDVVFLQPIRAVNLVKGCQAWVLSDDDDELDEEVESAMLPIFMYLAPILQNVPGGHWAFIFDVLEAVLERVSPGDDAEEEAADNSATLVALARALRLLQVLEELTKRNKALMAEWADRRMGILTIVRDLSVLQNDSENSTSIPHSTCRELVLSVVQHLPASLIDENTLPKLCHLIEDPSIRVQKMAYQFLKVAAQKRTEHLVIEAGIDTEATVQAVLPPELLLILQREMQFTYDIGTDEGYGDDHGQNLFGYLLGWMLVFDLFRDASFRVKSSYVEQLKSLNLITNHLIPCFLGILRLDQGGLAKVFKLELWAVDKFYVDLYEAASPHAIPVLTAHLYYRSLLVIPSLIHSWILDCKDRQLTNTVTAYTSTYFSPVLIRSELEHVRSHASSAGLADENMTVKVANAVNEVAAAYSVDEHQLEIKLRLPGDWPLHKIEIRDVKPVGVDENRWRAWVLGIQQTIWANNGRIVDGLGLFKRNVTLHFEGQVECAICYSIISVMDGTLPKKPCKICKNRFHAGCLYKWFNSSHSSSCPLCRSDII